MTCLAIQLPVSPSPALEVIHRIRLSGVDEGIVTGDGRYLVEHERDVPWYEVQVRMPTESEWTRMRRHVCEMENGHRGVVTDRRGKRTVNSVGWIS